MTTHRYKSAYRGLMIFAGVLTALLIITLPIAIWLFYIGFRGRVDLTDEQLTAKHFRTRTVRFADVQRFGQMSVSVHVNAGGGILGAILGGIIARKVYGGKSAKHLVFQDGNGKTWSMIASLYEDEDKLVMAVQDRVGKEPEFVSQGMMGPKWPAETA